jgi:LAO/AO transport system kinase
LPNNFNNKSNHSWSFERKDVGYYIKGLNADDRSVISQCISLAESTQLEDKMIVNGILKETSASWIKNPTTRIGITGPPGVGKSSFIELMGTHIAEVSKNKLAVLAIDPSSADSKGAILGDLTRMEVLTQQQNVYLRPNANNQHLGGLTHNTATSILICETAGYDTTLLESVGIGQSEIQIQSMVDVVILLLQPGSGDSLQGIKKGVMEVADILVVNKTDGDTANLSQELGSELRHLFPNKVVLNHSNVDTNSNQVTTILESIQNLIVNKKEKRIEQHKTLISQEIKAAILDHTANTDYYQQLSATGPLLDYPSDAYVKLRKSLANQTF